MEALDKKEKMNQLFEFYRPLFTEKQILYFELYYQEDYSLAEISELYQVSRNAIFEHVKKVEENLIIFEEKLKLLEKENKRKKLIDEIIEKKDLALLQDLRKLDE
jgi:predicted DNA-binding protein YlxM (UPF0122 family)